MKKLLIAFSATLLLFTSCKDDEPTPTLTIDKEMLNFTADGSAADNSTLTVTTNMEWTATSSQDWFSVTPTSGSGSAMLTVTTIPNPEYDNPRTATITVALKNGGLVKTLAVTQQPKDHELEVTPTELSFKPDGMAADGNTLTVTATGQWELLYDNEDDRLWCSVTPTSGSGSDTLTVTTEINGSMGERTATLTIKIGKLSKQVTIQQQPVNLLDSIPDPTFNNYCKQFDYNRDGILTRQEAAAIEHIIVDNKGIASLEGIAHFTRLVTLLCSNNPLTELDVSKNTALTFLACTDNQLTELDVSKNTELVDLSCANNLLTRLDVRQNTELTSLICINNQLTELDVSRNIELTELNCGNNRINELNVSSNIALTFIYCVDNQLTTLDVSKNTELTALYCYNNQLTELDVSRNIELTELDCSNNQINELNVSSNTKFAFLACADNQLTTLDVSKNTELTALYCYNNRLTILDVSKHKKLIGLSCFNNQLTTLNVSKSTALTLLACYNNRLTTLDVSKSTALTDLYCSDNRLSALNISGCSALTTLYCLNNSNPLTITVWQGFDASNPHRYIANLAYDPVGVTFVTE